MQWVKPELLQLVDRHAVILCQGRRWGIWLRYLDYRPRPKRSGSGPVCIRPNRPARTMA